MRMFFHITPDLKIIENNLIVSFVCTFVFSRLSSPFLLSIPLSLGSTSQRSPTGTKPKITLDPYIRLKLDKLDLVSPVLQSDRRSYFRDMLLLTVFLMVCDAEHVWRGLFIPYFRFIWQDKCMNPPLSVTPSPSLDLILTAVMHTMCLCITRSS